MGGAAKRFPPRLRVPSKPPLRLTTNGTFRYRGRSTWFDIASAWSVGLDIVRIRGLLSKRRIILRFSDHAFIEARKDGLTAADLRAACERGEVVGCRITSCWSM